MRGRESERGGETGVTEGAKLDLRRQVTKKIVSIIIVQKYENRAFYIM